MFIYCVQPFSPPYFFLNTVIIGHSQFLNFHGEANARLERNFSVYGDPIYPRTLLIKTLSLVLFSAPDIHLRTLQNNRVDGIIHRAVWQGAMKELGKGWGAFVLGVSDGLGVLAP